MPSQKLPPFLFRTRFKVSFKTIAVTSSYGRISMLHIEMMGLIFQNEREKAERCFVRAFYLLRSSKDRGRECPKHITEKKKKKYHNSKQTIIQHCQTLILCYIFIYLKGLFLFIFFFFIKKAALKLIRHCPTMH